MEGYWRCWTTFFLVRLSRRRFIYKRVKTNDQIVSKILTVHLGETRPIDQEDTSKSRVQRRGTSSRPKE